VDKTFLDLIVAGLGVKEHVEIGQYEVGCPHAILPRQW
jgi:hypothetical protein